MFTSALRLRPFSHRPHTTCLIPGTTLLVEGCPARIRLKDQTGCVLKEVVLGISGPLKQFTVMQDLERGCVTVFSERYCLHVLPDGRIVHSKHPGLPPLPVRTCLSLGMHKKQEWEGMCKRLDFREIFPIWFRLGSLLDLPERTGPDEGMFSLLKESREAIASGRPEQILPGFRKLFLAGFHELCVPRLVDAEFQGILPPDAPLAGSSALYLLSEGAALIRSLFFTSSAHVCALLPHLPPEFSAGRLCHLASPPYGEFDLEWSKKTLRRLVLRSAWEGTILLQFRPSLRRYRLRCSKQERGEIRSCGEPLDIKSGVTYFLDQFQK